MIDAATAIARFAVHLDLLLLFGLAAYPLYGDSAVRRPKALALLAIVGLAASLFAFADMAAAMAGLTLATLDREIVATIAFDTDPGRAFLVRMAALAMAVPLARRSWTVAALAAIALTSLAWSGHAAMNEGTAGIVHRGADIVHLLAAGAWIGALGILLARTLDRSTGIERLHAALSRFGVAGSVLVASIVLTGIVNLWLIVGPDQIARLPATLYGQLLALKLAAFAAMLALAANNRWRLTPRLCQSPETSDHAVRGLRFSILCELACAIGIIALVAFLGTLSPTD